jgi:hypothetical protein
MSGQVTLPGIQLPRPKRHSDETRRGTALALLPEVQRWLNEPATSNEDLIAQMVSALQSCGSDHDGYKLARALEQTHCWDPDAELVEILADAEFHADRVYEAEMKDWVLNNRAVLEHRLSTMVNIPTLAHVHCGPWKITSRREEVARFGVCHPGMRPGEEYIVDAENVFAVEP